MPAVMECEAMWYVYYEPSNSLPQAKSTRPFGWGAAAHLVGTLRLQDTKVSSCAQFASHMSRCDPMKWVNIYVVWYDTNRP